MKLRKLEDYVAPPKDGDWTARLAELAQDAAVETPRKATSVPDELGLATWVRGLEPFGRVVLVRAAIAAAEHTLSALSESSEWRAPLVRDVIDAVSQASVEDPRAQIEAAKAWTAAPSSELASATLAALGEPSSRPQEVWEPEFDYVQEEAAPWALRAAEACALSVTDPRPADFAAAAAVAALKAVRIGYVDRSVPPLERVCAWISDALSRGA